MVSYRVSDSYPQADRPQTRIYFFTHPTSRWARLGIAWIVFVLVICLLFAVLQQSMAIRFSDRFTAWQYQDFVSNPINVRRTIRLADRQFFFKIQVLLNSLIYAPVLLFFLRRAYHIWDRRRAVLYVGYVIVGASFVMRMIA